MSNDKPDTVTNCVNDLRKFRGLSPYNTPSNYVANDGYFGAWINRNYSKQTRAVAEAILEREGGGNE